MRKPRITFSTAVVVLVAAVVQVAATAHAVAAVVETGFSPGGGEQLVLRTINDARKSVRVMAYSFTSRTVTAALIGAHRRGVDVAVTVDYRSNVEEDRSGRARAALSTLVYAGIPVRTVRAFDLQHSKYVLVDSTIVQTGSFNYSAQAARRNSENVVVIRDAPDVSKAFAANWRTVTGRGDRYRAR